MPKSKKVAAAARAAEPAATPKSDSFRVVDANGATVREYTTEQHGPEAAKLASEFAAKKGLRVL